MALLWVSVTDDFCCKRDGGMPSSLFLDAVLLPQTSKMCFFIALHLTDGFKQVLTCYTNLRRKGGGVRGGHCPKRE